MGNKLLQHERFGLEDSIALNVVTSDDRSTINPQHGDVYQSEQASPLPQSPNDRDNGSSGPVDMPGKKREKSRRRRHLRASSPGNGSDMTSQKSYASGVRIVTGFRNLAPVEEDLEPLAPIIPISRAVSPPPPGLTTGIKEPNETSLPYRDILRDKDKIHPFVGLTPNGEWRSKPADDSLHLLEGEHNSSALDEQEGSQTHSAQHSRQHHKDGRGSLLTGSRRASMETRIEDAIHVDPNLLAVPIAEMRFQRYLRVIGWTMSVMIVYSICAMMLDLELLWFFRDMAYDTRSALYWVLEALRLSNTIITGLLIFGASVTNYCEFQRVAVRNPLAAGLSFYHSPMKWWLSIEILLLSLHVPAFVSYLTNNLISQEWNVILFVRFYHFVRILRDNSFLSGNSGKFLSAFSGVRFSYTMVLKTMLSRYPNILGMISLLTVLLCSTYAVYVFERSHSSQFTFGNTLWLLVITMTTVGYGDIVPRTLLGRSSVVLGAVLGLALSAFLIAVIHQKINLNRKEERLITFLYLHEKSMNVRNAAARSIQSFFQWSIAKRRSAEIVAKHYEQRMDASRDKSKARHAIHEDDYIGHRRLIFVTYTVYRKRVKLLQNLEIFRDLRRSQRDINVSASNDRILEEIKNNQAILSQMEEDMESQANLEPQEPNANVPDPNSSLASILGPRLYSLRMQRPSLSSPAGESFFAAQALRDIQQSLLSMEAQLIQRLESIEDRLAAIEK